MSDLIGDIFNEFMPIEDNNAVDILQEQARLIGKKSNNIVKGSFAKIEYTQSYKGAQEGLKVFASAISAMGISKEEIIEDELKSQTDINRLYNFTSYKFEIYNNTYKFRILTLNNRDFFPIEINLDEGISDELKINNPIKIYSNNQLEDLISSVFSCNKIKVILNKMMQYKENTIKNQIITLLSSEDALSASDISEKLGISRASTNMILKKLKDSGEVIDISERKKKVWKLFT